MTGPAQTDSGVFNLAVDGRARIGEQSVVHRAVPAENMMQAFAYWHLVPEQDLSVSVMNRGQFRVALKLLDPASVKIPAGGTAGVKVRTPGNQFTNNFQLELSAPPDGITIENITAIGTETEILLHSDSTKIKPGARGNLIVNVMAKRPLQPARAGAPARANQSPPPVGALPAIPFEIVAP